MQESDTNIEKERVNIKSNKVAALVQNILIFLMTFLGTASFSVSADKDPHIGLEDSIDSHDCLNCHDGLLAEHPMNHPFNVNYLEAQINRPGAVLRPIIELPSAIVLIENQIVCFTCHNMESNLPFKLRLTLERSVLCLACHDR